MVKFKNIMLVTMLFLAGVIQASAQEIQPPTGTEFIFGVGFFDPTGTLGDTPRSPIRPLKASLDDNTLTINGVHSGYTLYLIDDTGEEPVVVYQVVIPAGVNTVVLPAYLSGTYELQLYNGGAFYFYTYITL